MNAQTERAIKNFDKATDDEKREQLIFTNKTEHLKKIKNVDEFLMDLNVVSKTFKHQVNQLEKKYNIKLTQETYFTILKTRALKE